ncbi:MAG: hypothetical protein KJ000_11570 [Pirellulaceae bacterium]|nr:hypothetical protein [Pirellulaceae bacterium]
MSHEILYTSAPQGLKPGSRGFCTVVSTTGLAKNLAERLESFSGYRHAFMAHDSQAGQNPVNYTHYHTTVGGRKFHILSRVADAGLDYTQRSNKLAHHVALEPAETVDAPGGPAWVMADKNFFVQQWDGHVRTLPVGRQPTFVDRPAQICRCWKQLTGDAGWGGVLAESALRKGGVMSVIFPAGTAVLDLVVESLGLLPPERRWEVTFSTYFTKAPAGVDCQWRFLLDGTPEATALRRDVRASVIDLCNQLGQAQGGELIKAARTGVVSYREPVRGAAPLTRTTPDAPRPVATAPSRVEIPEEPDDLALAPPTPSFVRRPSAPPAWLPPEQPARRNRWLLPAVACGLLLAFLGIVVIAVLLSNRFEVPAVQVVDTDVKPPDSPPLQPDDPEAAKQNNDPPEEEPEDSFEAAPPVGESDSPDEPRPAEKEKPAPPPKPNPFLEIKKLQNRLQLPPLTVMEGTGSFAKPRLNTEKRELAKLNVKSSQDVQLELVGKEFEPRIGQTNTITHVDENGMRRWEVTTDLRPASGIGDAQTTKIATFELQDGVLRFNWEDWKTDRLPLRLAFCSLKLAADGQDVTCTFELPPKTAPSAQLKLEPGARISLAQGGEFALRPDDDLVLDLKFRGIKGDGFTGKSTTKVPKATFSVPVPHSVSNAKVELELSLVQDQREGLWIEGKLFGMAPLLSPSERSKDVYWKSHNWNRGPTTLELSDNDVLKKHLEDAEYLFSQVKLIMQSQFKFKDLKNWLALPATTREIAVGQYARLDDDIEMFRKDETKKGLTDAQRDRYHGYIRDLNELSKKHPDVPKAYQNHGLDNPDTRDIAKTYNKFAPVIEEVRAWHGAMKQFKTDLHNQARLDYRLYVKVDDREITLVETEGFSNASPKAKD